MVCRKFRVEIFPHMVMLKKGLAWILRGEGAVMNADEMRQFLIGGLQLEGEPMVVDDYLAEFYSLTGKYHILLESLSDFLTHNSEALVACLFGSQRALRWSDSTKLTIFSLLALGYPVLLAFWGLAWLLSCKA